MTPRQKELLDFLRIYIRENEYAPSFAEIMQALSIASRSNVYRLLTELEQAGHIKRLPKKARAIELVSNPTYLAPNLTSVTQDHLKAEAKRRGLVLCHAMRDEYGGRVLTEVV